MRSQVVPTLIKFKADQLALFAAVHVSESLPLAISSRKRLAEPGAGSKKNFVDEGPLIPRVDSKCCSMYYNKCSTAYPKLMRRADETIFQG